MTPYFPFLKAKRGEYSALAALDPVTRSSLVPILELLPARKPRQKADRPPRQIPTMDSQVASHVQCVAEASSTCYPVLIDFTHLPEQPTSDGRHPAQAIMSELLSKRVRASPVVRPSSSLGLLRAIKGADCLQDGLGLRLSPTDFDFPVEHIDIVLSSLGVEVEVVDVILDFGAITDAGALRRGMMRAALTVQGQRPWRSLSIGAASFPPSLTDFGEGEHHFPRLEWHAWRGLEVEGRQLGFADYGIRDASRPVEGGVAPIPNVRYTTADEWLVLRAKAAESRFYPELAGDLRHTTAWQDRSHCAGCSGLHRCAEGQKGRTAEQAIQFGMIHHLTCVTQQLANWDAGIGAA